MSSASAAQQQQEVPRQGIVSAKDYEARLKEVLQEVKKASRPNEPEFIDLFGIYEPESMEEKIADEPEKHEQKMKEVVSSLSEHYRRQGWRDFEKCKTGPVEFIACEGFLLTLAIKAKDPTKGITWGEFLEEMSAYEGGAICWRVGEIDEDECEFLRGGKRDSCGRYRLQYDI
ncbi:unnamed protein product [Vitrella brassicaformis CCMP3155]|uniref:Uncharacterized protein n=1 Tax=Vitrella brassicaformis (strain CCMP3155) TaxID=1169540 RepID=A0A0G4ERB1_VITBC|nr:unnamed protein product [Vitrella brassicaformis CCMP3155]|eukprot:CEL99816.1 unnamed protein product [Vitrella brassicaformis CCMP3155]